MLEHSQLSIPFLYVSSLFRDLTRFEDWNTKRVSSAPQSEGQLVALAKLSM